MPLTLATPHAPLQVPLTEAEKAERAAAAASKPNKLALGTEGGFALDAQKDYTLDKSATLVVLQGLGQPRLQVPLPCPDLPELVLNVITAIQVGAINTSQRRAAWHNQGIMQNCMAWYSASQGQAYTVQYRTAWHPTPTMKPSVWLTMTPPPHTATLLLSTHWANPLLVGHDQGSAVVEHKLQFD
jgi:hypothetical protein